MKISAISQLDIHAFAGSGVTEYEAGMTNVMVHDKNGRIRATQRPGIDISEDSTAIAGLNNRGRGIFYWEINSKLYIVHDGKVFANTQNSPPIGLITAGTERVQILETIGVVRMVILDAENNEGWVTDVGETVLQIASNFPTTLVHGGQILNGFLFVMDEDGIIYNSEVDDPTVFPALGFIEAERQNDKGVYLGLHHDHLPAFGTRTIEFFRYTGDQTGSPITRRQDISYNIGCVSGTGVWENGDKTYFVGSNPQGQLNIYKLESFNVAPVSTDTFSSYLTEGITQNSLKVVLNGVSFMGSDVLIMTVYIVGGSGIDPKISFAFDTVKGVWSFIHTTLNGHNSFPLMSWTKRTGGQNATLSARTGEGILHNGDIININDNLVPIDTILGNNGVFEAGVFELDVFVNQTANNFSSIPITIRTGLQDFDTTKYKFQTDETVVMESTNDPQVLTVKHSDEVADNFDAGNTIDTSEDRKDIHQGGRFIKRNFQMEYSGTEQIFIERLDIEAEVGL